MNPNEKFQINYIDCSGLCSFSRCPAKYMLSRLMGVITKDTTSIALDYGTIMHECLPFCYNHSLSEALTHFDSLWSQTPYGEDDKKRNTPCAHLLLENFWLNHHGDKCAYTPITGIAVPVPHTTNKIHDGEIPFLIDIGAYYPFAGRIDLPVTLKANKSHFTLDYKTSGEISERFFSGFDNHPQAVGYTMALHVLTGLPISGFIVEAIRVAPIPKRPSKVPPNQWHPIHITDAKQRWFLSWAKRLSHEIHTCNESGNWPRNLAACSPYSQFGMPGYSCPYKNLCPAHDFHSELRFYDRVEPWHPFVIDPQSPQTKSEELFQ